MNTCRVTKNWVKVLASTVQTRSKETHLTVSVNACGYNIISKTSRHKTCEMRRCKCGVRHFYSWCKCTILCCLVCYRAALIFTVISTEPKHVSPYSHISPSPLYQSDSQQFMHAKDKWSDFLFPFTCPNPLGLHSIFHFLHRGKKSIGGRRCRISLCLWKGMASQIHHIGAAQAFGIIMRRLFSCCKRTPESFCFITYMREHDCE